jgi:hypothetical protein
MRSTVQDRQQEAGPDIKTLHAKIGQLALENDILAMRARTVTRIERQAMITPTTD